MGVSKLSPLEMSASDFETVHGLKPNQFENCTDVKLAYLSRDVASGSDITPCNQIIKPLVVYRFSGNVMTSIITLRKKGKNLMFSHHKCNL